MTVEARDERFGDLPEQAIIAPGAPGWPPMSALVPIGEAALPFRPQAFAAGEPDGGYLLSRAHCRALACRMLAAVSGGSFVVVGDLPRQARRRLCDAISEAGSARFHIIEVASQGGPVADVPACAAAAPLFVIDGAEQLSAEELRHIRDAVPEGSECAVVLLAGTGFTGRLDLPELDFLRSRITLCLCFGELGDDEVEPFIRRQLPAIAEAPPLSATTLAAIAELSGGDPRRADRLARFALGMAPDAVALDDMDIGEGEAGPAPPLLIAPPAQSERRAMPRPRLGVYALVGLVAVIGLAADGYALARAAFGPPAAAAIATPLATGDIPVLLARGDAFLERGDFASARLFYDRAANAGSSTAALRLANTFDPAFLARAGVHGVLADPRAARRWYRRARELQSR